ncbi:hypothetical protein [Roseicitreum antarcticum]|uniref:Uncharacterized protein n=1 Tax=Roseicitreum antarcticum TaxID=564137 RepID=A0A1H3G9Y3_9RHOB|nr:hypothetical protein [Roseicitreum antarcticum]SDY00132.1 hypothetical protein SAMN04488238_1742 [Roseicitreum antarcticum]
MSAPARTPLDAALRALNAAAYLAAHEARMAKDPRADDLKRMSLQTDDLVDGRSVMQARQKENS